MGARAETRCGYGAVAIPSHWEWGRFGTMERSGLSLVIAVAMVGCGTSSTCVEGMTIACACPDGSAGLQSCEVGAGNGVCDCDHRSDGGMDASGPHDAAADAIPVDATQADGSAVPTMVSAEIGPEGGTLSIGGATVTIPPGALGSTEAITVRTGSVSPSLSADLHSPVFEFMPHGLEFEVPVIVELPHDGSASPLQVLWSEDGSSWSRIGATILGSSARARVSHFSHAVVADDQCGDAAREESEECDDGNRYAGDGCSDVCTLELGWYGGCDSGPPAPAGQCYVLDETLAWVAKTCAVVNSYDGFDISGMPAVLQVEMCTVSCVRNSDCPSWRGYPGVCANGLATPGRYCFPSCGTVDDCRPHGSTGWVCVGGACVPDPSSM